MIWWQAFAATVLLIIIGGCAVFAVIALFSAALVWWESPERVAKRENRAKVRALRAANGPRYRSNGWL